MIIVRMTTMLKTIAMNDDACEVSQNRRVGLSRRGGHRLKASEVLQNQRVGPGRRDGHGLKVCEVSQNRRVRLQNMSPVQQNRGWHLCSRTEAGARRLSNPLRPLRPLIWLSRGAG